MRSIKDDCLNRIIPLGERHLKLAIKENVEHYNAERNHQGIGNRLIRPKILSLDGEISWTERLGGMLKYYSRQIA